MFTCDLHLLVIWQRLTEQSVDDSLGVVFGDVQNSLDSSYSTVGVESSQADEQHSCNSAVLNLELQSRSVHSYKTHDQPDQLCQLHKTLKKKNLSSVNTVEIQLVQVVQVCFLRSCYHVTWQSNISNCKYVSTYESDKSIAVGPRGGSRAKILVC